MSKKSYSFAQLEAVAQEMRKNPDMVFFYEYETPVATLPTGEILDLVKEFGTRRTSGRGWAIDESWIVGTAIGAATAGSIAIARVPSMATIDSILNVSAPPRPQLFAFSTRTIFARAIVPRGIANTPSI